MPSVALLISSFEPSQRGIALAARLGLPPVDSPEPRFTHLLAWREGHLEVRSNRTSAPGPVWVDFAGASARRWRARPGRDREIARAVGLGRGTATVLDGTAGLGRDAFTLACCGLHVHAVERRAVVFALLEDGLRRAEGDAQLAARLGSRLTAACADARAWLAACAESARPDVVYLDPMFPSRAKSALVKKEMRLFQELIGDDDDAAELLALARRRARRRAVVKRPKSAPPLAARPDAVVAGQRVRWDVYLTRE